MANKMRPWSELLAEIDAIRNDPYMVAFLGGRICWWPRRPEKRQNLPYTKRPMRELTYQEYHQMHLDSVDLWKRKHGL